MKKILFILTMMTGCLYSWSQSLSSSIISSPAGHGCPATVAFTHRSCGYGGGGNSLDFSTDAQFQNIIRNVYSCVGDGIENCTDILQVYSGNYYVRHNASNCYGFSDPVYVSIPNPPCEAPNLVINNVTGATGTSCTGFVNFTVSTTDCDERQRTFVWLKTTGGATVRSHDVRYAGATATFTGIAPGAYVLESADVGHFGNGLCLNLVTQVPITISGNGCDDANACNGLETCINGTGCVNGTPLECDDDDVCNGIETCDPQAGCQYDEPLDCDDGDACNGIETCDPGSGCVPGTPLDCDDDNACNGEEKCDPGSGCAAGVPLHCDDEDVCNGTETCDPELGCQPGIEMVCDDGDVCDGEETCDPSAGCQEGTPLDCDDGNTCTDDQCDPLTGCPDNRGLRVGNCCTSDADCPDEDGLVCTFEYCDDYGLCAIGELRDCCVTPGDCLDEACTIFECVRNECVPAGILPGCCVIPEDCDEGFECTQEECIGGQCQRFYDHDLCDDGSECTSDVCYGYVDGAPGDFRGCVYKNRYCDDNNPCTKNGCDPETGCDYKHSICEESPFDDLCTENRCDNGHCLPVKRINCKDTDDCTIDGCDPATGCTHVTIVCTSTNPCTNAYCHKGSCKYRPIPRCGNKQSEDENGDEEFYEEEEYGLTLEAYPNPFSDNLNIEFTLPEDSKVKLEIYNISGQRLATVFEGAVNAGEQQTFEFNPAAACDCMFIYRLQTEQGAYYGKAVMVR